jgi:ATP-dependent DNA helicase RecG
MSLLPVNIDDVLHARTVESERLEFKRGWNPEAVLHTVCAFANDFHNLDGGYIFVGIEEDRGRPVLPPVGLSPEQLDAIQKEILNMGFSKIQPAYHPIVAPYEMEGRHVLVIWAPGGQNRPYKAADTLARGNQSWSYYIRKTSSTVKARGDDERELLTLAARIPFDDRQNQQASLADLKLSLIQAHLSDIGSQLVEEAAGMDFERLCRQMHIVGGAPERPLPLNVGLMFFNEDPSRFFPQTQIDVVQFPESPGADVFSEQIFGGPLSRMVREALSHVRSTVLRESVVKRPDRAEADRFFNYPYAAVEEALVNAVYHRDYQLREPIEVRVLPDSLVITSYPGPDQSISMDALASGSFHARRYRNRRIGEFFKELELTEGRGTGVPKMRRAMRENGSPDPLFETDENRTYFTVILPVHPLAAPPTPGGTPGETPAISPDVLNGLNGKMLDLLDFSQIPRDRASIQRRLGLKDQKHVRARYLKPLLDQGLLALTDPDHPSSRGQKYRTTNLGQAALLLGRGTPEENDS